METLEYQLSKMSEYKKRKSNDILSPLLLSPMYERKVFIEKCVKTSIASHKKLGLLALGRSMRKQREMRRVERESVWK